MSSAGPDDYDDNERPILAMGTRSLVILVCVTVLLVAVFAVSAMWLGL